MVDPMREAPQAYGAGGERVSTCAQLKTKSRVETTGDKLVMKMVVERLNLELSKFAVYMASCLR